MNSTTLRTLTLTLLAIVLAGCYESADVTRHEPGVYKGERDPLVAKLANDRDLREDLERRFDGQRDR